jgi:ankyrin repeat protein
MKNSTRRGEVKKTVIVCVALFVLSGIVPTSAVEKNMKEIQAVLNAELVKAAGSGDITKYRAYLKEGADFNKATGDMGENTLNIACLRGHLSIVRFIVEKRKVSVNIKSGHFAHSPLFEAATGNHMDVVKYLIGKGADVNLINRRRRTPIFEPALKGYLEIVKYLVTKGASVNVIDKYGFTPLHLAAKGNRFAVVKFLVEKGARLDVKNHIENKTPADFGTGRVKQYLLKRAGK